PVQRGWSVLSKSPGRVGPGAPRSGGTPGAGHPPDAGRRSSQFSPVAVRAGNDRRGPFHSHHGEPGVKRPVPGVPRLLLRRKRLARHLAVAQVNHGSVHRSLLSGTGESNGVHLLISLLTYYVKRRTIILSRKVSRLTHAANRYNLRAWRERQWDSV